MRKKIIICSALAAVIFAVVGLVLQVVIMSFPEKTVENNSSRLWGAEAHSHIAAYMTSENNFNDYSLPKAVSDIEKAYNTDSIETDKIIYSASYETSLSLTSVSGSRQSSCMATIYIGDYFKFHNYPMIEGTFPTDSDAVSDSILIDELAAWHLFGTRSGVTGMEIKIGENTYVVSGVTRVLDGIYNEVYGDYPHIYLRSDSAAYRMRENNYTVFEAMLPDPITNFAVNTITDALKSHEPIICDIDKRFKGDNLKNMNENMNKLIIDSSKTEYSFNEKAMLLLTIDAAKVYSVMTAMYYTAIIFAVILFFSIYSPIIKFVEKQLKKLRF